MRVISGKFRGRRFNPTRLKNTRPTTDFAREGLFNMLNHKIDFDEVKVLDLFCGSGGITFEFLSRGVQSVVCVDRDAACAKFIEGIRRGWNIDNLSIVKSDVMKYIDRIKGAYDVIFADPPYQFGQYEKLIESVLQGGKLNGGGMFILEHEKFQSFEEVKGFEESRQFGNVYFSFFSNQ